MTVFASDLQTDPELEINEFKLHAYLSGTLVRASHRAGITSADPALVARAELLVAMSEQFACPQSALEIKAGFDDPLQAALTFIRAADRIIDLQLRLDGLAFSYSSK